MTGEAEVAYRRLEHSWQFSREIRVDLSSVNARGRGDGLCQQVREREREREREKERSFARLIEAPPNWTYLDGVDGSPENSRQPPASFFSNSRQKKEKKKRNVPRKVIGSRSDNEDVAFTIPRRREKNSRGNSIDSIGKVGGQGERRRCRCCALVASVGLSRGKPEKTAALGRDASFYFFTRVTYVYPRFS